MTLLKSLSLKAKLILIILMVTMSVLLMGLTIEYILSTNRYKADLVDKTLLSSGLIAQSVTSSLLFNNTAEARDALSHLKAIPNILSCDVYDENGDLFASYKNPGHQSEAAPYDVNYHYRFEGTQLHLHELLKVKNKTIGVICMKASIRAGIGENHRLLINLLLVFTVLLLITFIIANRLQVIISKPIKNLALFLRDIAEKGDYSQRLKYTKQDEIGTLYCQVNYMLEKLEVHNKEQLETQEKLKQAKEQAEQSDKLKSAFLANMSHEIRTPMNAIVGFSHLLSGEDISHPKRIEYSKIINTSSESLLNLINDIIDISKIEAGEIKIHYMPCNVNQLLNDLVQFYDKYKHHQNKDHLYFRAIHSNITNGLIVQTDPLRLNQILSNLISNALKFTEEGGIEFGYTVDEEHKIIQFFVKDTGIGIPYNMQNIIFKRFQKIENLHLRMYRGAGLGLAISKSLAELLGGEIWVKSKENIGSVFYFTIPLDLVTSPQREPSETKINETIDWSDKTILIAEDEIHNYQYLKEMLARTQVQILWAKDGIEAVSLCMHHDVNAILMDIKMPRMNGYEAIRQIKKVRKVPVISQTAYAMYEEKKLSFEAGSDEYLTKPIDSELLYATLSKYLSNN